MRFNKKLLQSFFFVMLLIINSACTTMVLVNGAVETKTTIHRPGKEIKDIHIFLKESNLIVQYIGRDIKRENNKIKATNFNIEALYDLDESIKVADNYPKMLLIKPENYNEKHGVYKQEDGWIELPIMLEVSNKVAKHSHIVDRASNLGIEEYNKYIKREQFEINSFISLIKSANNKNTLVAASVLPTNQKGNSFDNIFDRRAIFIDTRSDQEVSYIMMMPAYKSTSGHGAKVGLLLLPITAAIDIVTSPVQVPLLIGASKIGK